MADRCPHRHAPLSMGRVEGNHLTCMYHGMRVDTEGQCVSVPLLEPAPACSVHVYPVHIKSSWTWVWMGDPGKAPFRTSRRHARSMEANA